MAAQKETTGSAMLEGDWSALYKSINDASAMRLHSALESKNLDYFRMLKSGSPVELKNSFKKDDVIFSDVKHDTLIVKLMTLDAYDIYRIPISELVKLQKSKFEDFFDKFRIFSIKDCLHFLSKKTEDGYIEYLQKTVFGVMIWTSNNVLYTIPFDMERSITRQEFEIEQHVTSLYIDPETADIIIGACVEFNMFRDCSRFQHETATVDQLFWGKIGMEFGDFHKTENLGEPEKYHFSRMRVCNNSVFYIDPRVPMLLHKFSNGMKHGSTKHCAETFQYGTDTPLYDLLPTPNGNLILLFTEDNIKSGEDKYLALYDVDGKEIGKQKFGFEQGTRLYLTSVHSGKKYAWVQTELIRIIFNICEMENFLLGK
jgi:hypothetical protein